MVSGFWTWIHDRTISLPGLPGRLPLHPVVTLTDPFLAAAVLDRTGTDHVERHGNLLEKEHPDQAHGEELYVRGSTVHEGVSARP